MVCKEKILLTALLIPILLLSACKNDGDKLKAYTHVPTSALMSARDIDVIYSESGQLQARISAPLVNRYSGEYPFLEFPKGFTIYMYDSLQTIKTTITGDYGKRTEKTGLMDAKGNVVVRNERKQEQLNTEMLTWDEKKHIIYTKVPVKITTPGKVLYGEGMESDESFSNYTIIRPKGQMSVKRDSL